MGVRLLVLLLAALPAIAQTQTALPPDINPVTLSRLPWVTPEDLDEEGRKLLAQRPAVKPGPGPTHVTNYSPRERSLGIPTGVDSPVGPRYFQLAVLIIAREIDQQYRMVRPRARGPAARTRAAGHRHRQVQPGRRGPVRQGRHTHYLWTHVVSRAPREQRVVAEDDRTLRAAADRAAHDDHGRLLQGGLHDERGRSAPAARAEGAAAAVEPLTNEGHHEGFRHLLCRGHQCNCLRCAECADAAIGNDNALEPGLRRNCVSRYRHGDREGRLRFHQRHRVGQRVLAVAIC